MIEISQRGKLSQARVLGLGPEQNGPESPGKLLLTSPLREVTHTESHTQ